MKRKAVIYQEDCMPISCPFFVDIYVWDSHENKFIFYGFRRSFQTLKQAVDFAKVYCDIIRLL